MGCLVVAGGRAQGEASAAGTQGAVQADAPNPYRLEPFEPQFPVELDYPTHRGREYERTRRQMLAQLAANLQGNVRREAWQMATEFFRRAPEDAVAPLIDALDRALLNPTLADVAKNVCDAMGLMAHEEFDAPLRRALRHSHEALRFSAYAALARCGKAETLVALRADFGLMDAHGRAAWLAAVRARLPEQRVAILRELMDAPLVTPVRDQVLKEAMQLPPSECAAIVRGRWEEALDEFKAIIAGVLHADGDVTGTAWLLDGLSGEDTQRLVWSVRNCNFGGKALGELRDPLLRASTHQRPEVRVEVARALTRVTGDDVVEVYENLSLPEEVWEVRSIALRELTRRGRNEAVTLLLEDLPTASGTRLQNVLNQLSASGDDRGVPTMVDRFRRAEDGAGRPFLQALAQNGSKAAAEALCELFLEPDRRVSTRQSDALTTHNYLPLIMMNLRGNEESVLQTWRRLPRDAYERRARLMATLTGIARDRRDPELAARFVAPVREVLFDRTELPQLRVEALNLLTLHWLTIDDALRLKNQRAEEASGMRVLFTDFLNDYF